jgi:shikimate kinase
MDMKRSNIILIGMPGAGKSTVGVLLAKALKKPFIDTDLLIQQRENSFLQEIINNRGISEFIKVEEEVVLGLNVADHIIATGGSVIYSDVSIAHLKSTGVIVFLNLKLYQLENRLKNIHTRGIAMKNGQSVTDLYTERQPLYIKYAEIEIDCSHKHIETIVSEIIIKTGIYMSDLK